MMGTIAARSLNGFAPAIECALPVAPSMAGRLLQTKGLIEIIFAVVLLDKGIISSATFTALSVIAPVVTPKLKSLAAMVRKRG